jgi:hypothetical protein
MGTTWVLHTETKGTGAQMVPLEKEQQRSKGAPPEFIRPQKRTTERAQPQAKPKSPRRFRIVDVMTRRELVGDAGIHDALAALKDVRSVVDVNVYVYDEDRGRWRAMTFEEQRVLMDLAAEGVAA